jgi:hypothetical protein
MHENPISSIHHLFCNLSIFGLIRNPEIPLPQIKKVKDETESNKENNLSPFGRMIDIISLPHELNPFSLFGEYPFCHLLPP